jgi:hypothetical protein
MSASTSSPRMQLQIIDTKSLNSWIFENQLHVPRRGDVVRIYDIDNDGAVLLDGTVSKVEWAYGNDNDDCTCSVFITESTDTL